MHEHHADDPEVLSEIEKLGYDPRDVPVEQTAKHAIALYVACVVMALVGLGVIWIYDKMQGSKSIGEQPLPVRQSSPQPPYPLLQSNLTTKKDIHDLRSEEKVKTDTAGWVDESKGIARIPVSAAMDILIQEGLPQTVAQAAPASQTNADPAAPGTAVDPALHSPGGTGR